jgi:uncharacterized pyridoxamine 5'-phosphate oxidase family protein
MNLNSSFHVSSISEQILKSKFGHLPIKKNMIKVVPMLENISSAKQTPQHNILTTKVVQSKIK